MLSVSPRGLLLFSPSIRFPLSTEPLWVIEGNLHAWTWRIKERKSWNVYKNTAKKAIMWLWLIIGCIRDYSAWVFTVNAENLNEQNVQFVKRQKESLFYLLWFFFLIFLTPWVWHWSVELDRIQTNESFRLCKQGISKKKDDFCCNRLLGSHGSWHTRYVCNYSVPKAVPV